MHLILYFHITFPGFECSNSCCITALLHASWEYKWANNCDDVWCVVTLCHATCHALSVMSVSDTTLARNKSQQNISEYKVIRRQKIYYWPHYGAHTHIAVKIFSTMWNDKLCLIFPRKSLVARPECTYLPRARNSTCWSVNFQKAVDMNLCEGSEHPALTIWNMILINCSRIISTCATLISLQTQCNIFKVPT